MNNHNLYLKCLVLGSLSMFSTLGRASGDSPFPNNFISISYNATPLIATAAVGNTRLEAENLALSYCGGYPNCRIIYTIQNGCLASAVDEGKQRVHTSFKTGIGATSDMVSYRAIQSCQSFSGQHCDVVARGCSAIYRGNELEAEPVVHSISEP